MTVYQLEEIKNIRGFNALTQGERSVELKLLNNINELKGKKAMGFVLTRGQVLRESFDMKSLEEFLSLSKELLKDGVFPKQNVLLKSLCKNLLEKIMRDFVPADMVEVFCKACNKMVEEIGSINESLSQAKQYFVTGKVPPISNTYREAVGYIEEKGGKCIEYKRVEQRHGEVREDGRALRGA